MMPFEGIKKLFPNVDLQALGDRIEVNIPASDIAEALKSNLRDDLKPYTVIETFPDGIMMRVDIGSSMLSRLKAMSPNIKINPETIEIFIPREDILKAFKISNPNLSVEYTEKGVTISAKLM